MSKLLIIIFIHLINIILCNTVETGADVYLKLARDIKDQVVDSVHNDCDTHDIFKTIPFHKVAPLVTTVLSVHPTERSVETIVGSPHFSSIVSGVVKSVLNQHLFGFFAGVGEHVADVVDHFVDVAKTVKPPSHNKNHDPLWNDILNIDRHERSKNTNYIEKHPLENVSGVIRKMVEYLPGEKVKHCYYNKYTHVAKQMKDHVNSTEFKNLLGRVYKSDYYNIFDTKSGKNQSKKNKNNGKSTKNGNKTAKNNNSNNNSPNKNNNNKNHQKVNIKSNNSDKNNIFKTNFFPRMKF